MSAGLLAVGVDNGETDLSVTVRSMTSRFFDTALACTCETGVDAVAAEGSGKDDVPSAASPLCFLFFLRFAGVEDATAPSDERSATVRAAFWDSSTAVPSRG